MASLKVKKEFYVTVRDVSNPDWIQSVFITANFTPKEQEGDRALRVKLNKLNATSKIYNIKKKR